MAAAYWAGWQGPTVGRGDGRETGDQRKAVVHVIDLAVAHVLALEALLAGRPSAVYNLLLLRKSGGADRRAR